MIHSPGAVRSGLIRPSRVGPRPLKPEMVQKMAARPLILALANPNPEIGYGEEFAEAAEAAGIDYEPLLDRLLAIGLRRR